MLKFSYLFAEWNLIYYNKLNIKQYWLFKSEKMQRNINIALEAFSDSRETVSTLSQKADNSKNNYKRSCKVLEFLPPIHTCDALKIHIHDWPTKNVTQWMKK